ncbi:hypothetical protein [Vibrio sp. MA40-2]|uniref:hypothetical protein n=1 Tax=Vibrio sp. MA40-2 TaxID=3391828 RepID=UPI0039A7378F
MHEMTLKLPPDVIRHLTLEADTLGLSYSKHLLAVLDVLATTQSKELINDELTRKRRTTD